MIKTASDIADTVLTKLARVTPEEFAAWEGQTIEQKNSPESLAMMNRMMGDIQRGHMTRAGTPEEGAASFRGWLDRVSKPAQQQAPVGQPGEQPEAPPEAHAANQARGQAAGTMAAQQGMLGTGYGAAMGGMRRNQMPPQQ